MKSFLIAIAFLAMVGCKSKAVHPEGDQEVRIDTLDQQRIAGDTIQLPGVKSFVDSTAYLSARYDSLLDVLKNTTRKLIKTNDSLRSKLFLANYKVEKVKYYLAICTRNPSQKKFLFGWMRRAVE